MSQARRVFAHSNVVVLNENKPAPITDLLAGLKIERLLNTGEFLLIRCTDGTEVRVSWRDDTGVRAGTPYLEELRRFK